MKKSFANSLFYPLAVFSSLFFILFAIIAYGIIEGGVRNSIEQNLHTSIDLFSDSIRENLVTGAESEVFRKCKSFSGNQNLKSLKISDDSGRIICDTETNTSGRTFSLEKIIYFDESHTEKAAIVSMSFADTVSSNLLVKSVTILLITLLLLSIIYVFIAQYLIKSNTKSVIQLANLLSEGNISSLKNVTENLSSNAVDEIRLLYQGVESQAQKVESYQTELVEAAQWKAAHELSNLVAHDIKSPLSNIEMIADDTDNDPNLRAMLKSSVERIYALLNEVLTSKKLNTNKNDESSIVSLLPIIKNCIDVTNFSLKSSSKVKIKLQSKKQEHFDVQIVPSSFIRAISNILKNSIEAVDEKIGKIEVSIYDNENSVIILFKDNGTGINKEKIQFLGSKGYSLNKLGGTGLGLYQVKEMVRMAKGSIQIESDTEKGMSIKIELPKYDADLKVDHLILEPGQPIVVVDDEAITHKRWKKKIIDAGLGNPIYYFSNSSSFCDWADRNPQTVQNAVGLFDFNLNENINGLDLFQKFDLSKKILVTGDNKNTEVLKSCRQLNISLLPKSRLPDFQTAKG